MPPPGGRRAEGGVRRRGRHRPHRPGPPSPARSGARRVRSEGPRGRSRRPRPRMPPSRMRRSGRSRSRSAWRPARGPPDRLPGTDPRRAPAPTPSRRERGRAGKGRTDHLPVHAEPVQPARGLDRDGSGTPVRPIVEVGRLHQRREALAEAETVDQPPEQRRIGPAVAVGHGNDPSRRGTPPGFEPGRVIVAPGRTLAAQEPAEGSAFADHLRPQGVGRGQLLALRLDHQRRLQGEAVPREERPQGLRHGPAGALHGEVLVGQEQRVRPGGAEDPVEACEGVAALRGGAAAVQGLAEPEVVDVVAPRGSEGRERRVADPGGVEPRPQAGQNLLERGSSRFAACRYGRSRGAPELSTSLDCVMAARSQSSRAQSTPPSRTRMSRERACQIRNHGPITGARPEIAKLRFCSISGHA